MDQNPTNITKIDESTFTYQVPNVVTIDVNAFLQEKQNNLDQIDQLNATIGVLTNRNTAIDTILALAPTGVRVPQDQSQG